MAATPSSQKKKAAVPEEPYHVDSDKDLLTKQDRLHLTHDQVLKKTQKKRGYGIDVISLALILYCAYDIIRGLLDVGWDRFVELTLLNPLMGGVSGPSAQALDLPLWSYSMGHIIPGVGISLLGAALLYIFAQEYKYADREDLRAAYYAFIAIAGSAPVVAPLHKIITEGRAGALYFDVNDWPLWWIPISLFISLLITESWFYWFHYAAHVNQFLWTYVHELHHTFVPSIGTCASSFHPLDIAGLTIGAFFVAFVVPIHHMAHSGFLLVNLVWGIYQHSAWRSRIPPALRLVFNDSMSHTIHHDMGRVPRNLGSLCGVWDRIMGTYMDSPPRWAITKPSKGPYAQKGEQ